MAGSGRRAAPRIGALVLGACVALSTLAQTAERSEDRAQKAARLVAAKPWIGSADEYLRLEPAVASQIENASDEVVRSLRGGGGWNPNHPKWEAMRNRVRADMRAAWDEVGRALLGGIEPARYQEHLVGLYLASFDDAGLDALLAFYGSPGGTGYLALLRELTAAAREAEAAVADVLAGGPARWQGQDPERTRARIRTLLVLEPMQAMANIAREPDDPRLAAGMSATLLTIVAVRGERIDALAEGLDPATRAAVDGLPRDPARAREREMLVAESERIYRAAGEWASALGAFLKRLAAQESVWKALAAD
ncbi:MAG: hypothetical protein N2544_04875 [Burkholderiales bacterium]|nr:hypothetical protein [Burkholderiales bacterium]